MAGRRLAAATVLLLAVVELVAGVAFACAPLATLDLDPAVAHPGDVVHVEGKGFLSAGVGAKTVDIRWNSPDGEVLASEQSDDQGRVSFSFVVPGASPGYFVVFASLRGVAGATARAVIQIPGPAAEVAPVMAPPVRHDRLAPGVVVVALGVVGLGLILAAAGFAMAARREHGEPEAVSA